MNKKGFTLVEVIVVIAIVAIASALVGTQFFTVLGKGGKADKFEDEVLAKELAESAYVLYESLPHLTNASLCINGESLIGNGYIIDGNQGLLRSYSKNDIKKFAVYVEIKSGEKITTVYKSKTGTKCSGPSNNPSNDYICCNTTNGTVIDY